LNFSSADNAIVIYTAYFESVKLYFFTRIDAGFHTADFDLFFGCINAFKVWQQQPRR
jgi:hypothetical protein